MSSTIICGSLYRLLSERAALADELARKVEDGRIREEALKTELMSIAPKNMHAYIENEVGLDILFIYGMCSCDIKFYDRVCGFLNMEDAKKKTLGLQKAWKGVIKIEVQFVERGDGRASIKFSAVL